MCKPKFKEFTPKNKQTNKKKKTNKQKTHKQQLQQQKPDHLYEIHTGLKPVRPFPEVGIMETSDRQVTTVFTVQPFFHHWHSTNQYHEALPSSVNVQSNLTS